MPSPLRRRVLVFTAAGAVLVLGSVAWIGYEVHSIAVEIRDRACFDEGELAACEAACRREAPETCVTLGDLLADKDSARAAVAVRTACEGEGPFAREACNTIGEMAETGRGLPKDVSAAAGHYRVACDGGSKTACAHLGLLLR